MKRLDLRSLPVRLAAHRWRGDPGATPGPLAAAADRLAARRVARRPAPPDGPLIVSVGNLALGGTGKTPVVTALALALADRGLRGGILTRGFGSSARGPLLVAATDPTAGDEARVTARHLAGWDWPVLQARHRPAGLARLLASRPHLDVILAEDAHQTAGLPRHLDVLILDAWLVTATAPPCLVPVTGPVFPLGPWRESARGARRAHVLLVETEQELPTGGPAGQRVCRFRRTASLHDVLGRPGPGPWAALSGIARPERFEAGATALLGSEPALAVRVDDHAPYRPRQLRRILGALEAAGIARVVTTAKDWIKLQGSWPERLPVTVVEQEILWGTPHALPDLVEERVRRRVRPGPV